MRPTRSFAVLVAVLLLGGALSSQSAHAHSTLVRACPGPGDVLNEVDRLELEFRTPLIDDGTARVDLIGSGDESVRPEVGAAVLSADLLTVTVDVFDPLPPGKYILRYQVRSGDGDLNDGGHEFTVDPDANPDSDGCELADDGGGSGGLVLLVVGVVAVGALVWFLRPTSKAARSDP